MQPLQYVVIHHTGIDEPHFDLVFETLPGSMLATWRSERWPIESITPLVRLRDHRRIYLTYEGDLSGQRGTVSRIAQGHCEVEVGENSIWRIRILTGVAPQSLIFRQLGGERWEAEEI